MKSPNFVNCFKRYWEISFPNIFLSNDDKRGPSLPSPRLVVVVVLCSVVSLSAVSVFAIHPINID